MLGWTLIFLIIALVAGVLGFYWHCRSGGGNREDSILYFSNFIFGVVDFPSGCQMTRKETKPIFERNLMPRGDKSSYTGKQKRMATHIEEGYEKRGLSTKESERRAWATVNKETGGGKRSGSGRGKG